MAFRITYRKKHTYNTKSNQIRLVRTPGGQYNVQNVKKLPKGAHTSSTLGHKRLAGVKRLRCPQNAKRNSKTVTRAYGGVLSGRQVRDRIVRAFLIEEGQIVKKVLKTQRRKAAAGKN